MKIKMIILMFCIVLLAVGCASNEDSSNAEVAMTGDTVKVNYVGKFENGTVFDTNIQSVAEANGMQKSQYQPLQVILGQGQVIPGFDNAIMGMAEGEEKTVTIPPAQAYGERSPGKSIILDEVIEVNRTATLNRYVNVTLETLGQLPGAEEVGDMVSQGDIDYEVVSKDDNGAQLLIHVDEGDQIVLPNTLWNSTVVEVEDETYVVRQDPIEGSQFNTPYGPASIEVTDDKLRRVLQVEEGGQVQSQSGVGRITNVEDGKIHIDFNHPLAGQTLVFEIELVDIVE